MKVDNIIRLIIIHDIIFSMVRNNIRKTFQQKYSKDLLNAVQLIQNEKWSYRKESGQFNVSLGTLSTHVLNTNLKNIGHPPTLTIEQEQDLVNLIIALQEWGQLSMWNDIPTYASEYVDIMGLKSSFVGGCPGKDWYYGFLKRWSNKLKLMHSGSLEKARAKGITLEIINEWFELLYSVLKKLNLFDKPQNVFNMDESSFCEEPGRRIVVVKRGTKYANH